MLYSYRADGPLKGSCNIVMKVACCSDVTRPDKSDNKYKAMIQHKAPEYDPGVDDGDDDGEYYAVVKSKILRIPCPSRSLEGCPRDASASAQRLLTWRQRDSLSALTEGAAAGSHSCVNGSLP